MNTIPVLMPCMGQSIAEGIVVKWHKGSGESVKAQEVLVDVESDKIAIEVSSPADGTVASIRVREGELADVGTAIATIETESEVFHGESVVTSQRDLAKDVCMNIAPCEQPPGVADGAKIPAELPDIANDWLSPSVARLALRHGVSMDELETLQGSGRGDRITRHDLIQYISVRPPMPGFPSTRDTVDVGALKEQGRVVPMSAIRRSIADHMVQSIRTSAHVTMVHSLDVTQLVTLRNQVEEGLGKISYTAIMLYLLGRLLRRFPNINASTFGSYILQRETVNIGCAVALPDESLVVPVIRNADALSMPDLSMELNRLTLLARNRELTREDVEGGTFTVSNFGTFGALFGTPIIVQPQVAILGMGTITKQPVPSGDSFRFADTLYLSLSFDHRIIDGAMAGRFFQGVQEGVLALSEEDMLR